MNDLSTNTDVSIRYDVNRNLLVCTACENEVSENRFRIERHLRKYHIDVKMKVRREATTKLTTHNALQSIDKEEIAAMKRKRYVANLELEKNDFRCTIDDCE